MTSTASCGNTVELRYFVGNFPQNRNYASSLSEYNNRK